MVAIIGNLLDIDAGVILHQVNCNGELGGLADALHFKHRVAFVQYFIDCDLAGDRNLGTSLVAQATPELSICHVFGQRWPGPSTDLRAVDAALAHAAPQLVGRMLFAPYRMGCGIGGGHWPDYLELLYRHLPHVTIIQRMQDL